MQIYRRGK